MEGTHLLLSLLWKAGYKVSQKKAQIFQETVKYLEFHLSQGQCRLGPERKQAICSIPAPKTHQQIREFLRATVSAESGSPITLSWQNPFMKPQRVGGGENRNP
jgi:hypothetical protein